MDLAIFLPSVPTRIHLQGIQLSLTSMSLSWVRRVDIIVTPVALDVVGRIHHGDEALVGIGELGIPLDREAPVGEVSRDRVEHDGIAVEVRKLRDVGGSIKHVQLDFVRFPVVHCQVVIVDSLAVPWNLGGGRGVLVDAAQHVAELVQHHAADFVVRCPVADGQVHGGLATGHLEVVGADERVVAFLKVEVDADV